MINNLGTKTSSKEWKKTVLIIVGVTLVISVTYAIISAIQRGSLKYENNGGYYEITYQNVDSFSEILNIYYNLPSEMPEEFFNEILESGKIDKGYIQKNENGGESYIATFPISSEEEVSQQNVEFISFNYILGDGETEVPTVSDVTYHSFRDGKHDYIQETDIGVYTHVSEDLSNSYDDKASAIDSFLMTTY